ncbi:MAG: C-GCAxxG-C-C family protein [Thermoproteota archaeon]|nr:C-GCAxxG-C-C family protein [Thermoproteota archaeon]
MRLNNYPKETVRYDTRSEEMASTGKILDRIAKAAYDNDRAYEGCTRCVLAALQEHLHLLDDDKAYRATLKASTALAAGVARRGETCGALIGAIMAVGLVTGGEHLDDAEGYVRAMEAAVEVFDRFKENYGTVKCFEIQENLFGRHYDFFNPEDTEAGYKDDGLDKCPGVCATAARIGAEVILELRKRK